MLYCNKLVYKFKKHLLGMIYLNLLIVFLFLIAIHEYGHYIVARFFGAEVSDFSIDLENHYLNLLTRMEQLGK